MEIRLHIAEYEKLEKLISRYKNKYQTEEEEQKYVAFFERMLKDAENCLTVPYFLLINDQIIGVTSLSASSIEVWDIEKEKRVDLQLYEDVDEIPAIRIDFFFILPVYRGKGFGSKALERLIAYLIFRQQFIGYRYLITLSTNKKFDQILLKKQFQPIISHNNLDEVNKIIQESLYRNTTEDKLIILREQLKKEGVWFYLDLGCYKHK